MMLLAPLLLVPCPAPPAEDPWVIYPGGAGAGTGKHVVLVSGDEEYRSEEALPMLGEVLSARHGFRCTVLFAVDPESGEIDPDQRGNVPGLAALDEADVLVLFTRFRRLPDEDMRHLVDYVNAGKPVVGIRTATHAFAYEEGSSSPYAHWTWNSRAWPGGFGRQVLGETWVAHHGRHGAESTRGVVAFGAREHPVLRGVEDVWGPTDVYGIRSLPADATVLLEGSVRAGMEPTSPEVQDPRNAPRMPIAWARERPLPNGTHQRIVCSTIGSSTDLRNEDLRRLFVNAVHWCAELEVPTDPSADATPVRPYDPTPFGFGGYRRGVRPKDHAPD